MRTTVTSLAVLALTSNIASAVITPTNPITVEPISSNSGGRYVDLDVRDRLCAQLTPSAAALPSSRSLSQLSPLSRPLPSLSQRPVPQALFLSRYPPPLCPRSEAGRGAQLDPSPRPSARAEVQEARRRACRRRAGVRLARQGGWLLRAWWLALLVLSPCGCWQLEVHGVSRILKVNEVQGTSMNNPYHKLER
jgi:hypothetical protein